MKKDLDKVIYIFGLETFRIIDNFTGKSYFCIIRDGSGFHQNFVRRMTEFLGHHWTFIGYEQDITEYLFVDCENSENIVNIKYMSTETIFKLIHKSYEKK